MKTRMGKVGAIGLALVLSTAALAPMAFADPTWETGNITVKPAGSSASNTTGDQPAGYQYKMAQIFKAQVDNGKAANLTWSSTAMKTAVEGAISAWAQANASEYTGTTEQDAADFIIANIQGTTSATILEDDSFGMALAKAVDDVSGAVTVTPWTKTSTDEGWVLVYTDPASIASGGAATSPIFALIEKDADVDINEKTTVPTANKQVKAAGDNSYASAVDAMIGEQEDFLITGTVPTNIASYNPYSYVIEDTMTGLELNLGANNTFEKADITVKFGDSFDSATAVPAAAYSATYNSGALTVTFTDLNTIDGVAGKKIFVAYQAALTADAVIGAAGNPNSCSISYSRNPLGEGSGTTTTTTTKSHTYQAEITKKDKDNDTVIPNVTFALTKSDGTTPVYVTGSAGSYTVTADSAAGNSVTTDASGKILIKGLDAGSYKLTETAVPDQFVLDANAFTITITSAISEGAYDSTETAGSTTGTFAVAVSGGAAADRSAVTAVSAANGKGEITIKNVLKSNDMPQTGMAGIAGVVIIGVVLIGSGIVIAIRRGRSED